jgi:hypothetical protein
LKINKQRNKLKRKKKRPVFEVILRSLDLRILLILSWFNPFFKEFCSELIQIVYYTRNINKRTSFIHKIKLKSSVQIKQLWLVYNHLFCLANAILKRRNIYLVLETNFLFQFIWKDFEIRSLCIYVCVNVKTINYIVYLLLYIYIYFCLTLLFNLIAKSSIFTNTLCNFMFTDPQSSHLFQYFINQTSNFTFEWTNLIR